MGSTIRQVRWKLEVKITKAATIWEQRNLVEASTTVGDRNLGYENYLIWRKGHDYGRAISNGC
jgi:hypothetical protein